MVHDTVERVCVGGAVSHYIHHIPGRLRLKSPRLKRNPGEGAALQALLGERGGIRSCEVNPVTGSMLVQYDTAETSVGGIWELLEERGYELHREPAAEPSQPAAMVDKVGKAVVGAVIEKVVERSALALIGAVL